MTPGRPPSVQDRGPADFAGGSFSQNRFSHLLLLFILSLTLVTAAAHARPYTVKSGDTLQRIAQRELGSANRWQEIARLNNLPPPHTIRVGQQIQLPDAGVPLALAPAASTTSNRAQQPASATSPPNQIPPGYAVSNNPSSPSSTPLPPEKTNDEPSKSLPWGLFLTLVFGSLVQACSLRISCWFSQIEATFLRCLKLALYLEVLGALCFVGAMLLLILGITLGMTGKFEPWTFAALIAVLPLALLLWFVLSLFVIKNTLDCKWRSVVTLLVMSWFVSWAVGIIIFISSASYAPLVKLLSDLPK